MLNDDAQFFPSDEALAAWGAVAAQGCCEIVYAWESAAYSSPAAQ